MRSTFKRGPGSGFGLSNLKLPHTLTNEENETVIEGGAAPLLGSVCPWRCTPSGVRHRDRLWPPDWGHLGVPNPRRSISRLAQLREVDSSL